MVHAPATHIDPSHDFSVFLELARIGKKHDCAPAVRAEFVIDGFCPELIYLQIILPAHPLDVLLLVIGIDVEIPVLGAD